MCLLAIQYRTAPGAAVLVAANRDEYFHRAARPPAVQSGEPRVVCGTDRRAGGTWLGVNQYGLFVAVTNRRKSAVPESPRSRGLLCRELLDCRTAGEAAQLACDQLSTGNYAGANFVCLDREHGLVVHGGDRLSTVGLAPGLHVIGNGRLNDLSDPRVEIALELFGRHDPRSAAEFVQIAAPIIRRPPEPRGDSSIVLRAADRGTVSSSLVAVTDDSWLAEYHYSPLPPDRCEFDDFSPVLREVLSPSPTG